MIADYLSLMESVVIDIWDVYRAGGRGERARGREGGRSYEAASGYETTLNTYHD